MITSTSKLQKSYDTVVIGGGISGLLIANHLQKSGQSTLIVDRGDLPGGNCRRQQSEKGPSAHGLKVIPQIANSESALQFLNAHLGGTLQWQEVERPPVTYEAGFKPYVGFGEEGPDYSDILNYYTQHKVYELSSSADQWVESLYQSFGGDFLGESFVTNIFRDENSKNSVAGVLINGSKKLLCQNIIYCGLPKDLPSLFGQDDLKGKTRRALGRGRLWTSIAYDIVFNQELCQHSAIHVLTGSKDKTEACLGLFHPINEESQQLSQWLTFIPADLTEDAELIAMSLRRVKKLLKRAYPESFEHKVQEHILISYASHGQIDLPLSGHQTLTPYDNLWVAGPFGQKTPNLIGAIKQAQLVLAAMGFGEDSIDLSNELKSQPLEPLVAPEIPLESNILSF